MAIAIRSYPNDQCLGKERIADVILSFNNETLNFSSNGKV